MGLFSKPSSKEIDAFAKDLAESLAKSYPPELDSDPSTSISAKRISNILEDVCAEATVFRKDKKLGIYKKARMGNTFKWALKDHGYSDDFIKVATEALVVYITRK
jgi:hypothetical protein